MSSLADLDRYQPTMLAMLAPSLFQDTVDHPLLLDFDEHEGTIAVVMLDVRASSDDLDLAIDVHERLARSGRGLLVVA